MVDCVSRVQDRAEINRAKLIKAGTVMFSERGSEGVSVRDLENTAGVKRNLLAYHFDNKDSLWKRVTNDIYGLMKTEFDQRLLISQEMSGRESLAFVVRFYVYFHARHPALSRPVAQEATQHSWRTQYMIAPPTRPGSPAMEQRQKHIQ